jgi:hypothetical protein
MEEYEILKDVGIRVFIICIWIFHDNGIQTR